MRIRKIKLSELDRSLFSDFHRRQAVTDCYRREGGQLVIRSAPFIDDWSEADYLFLVQCLRRTIETGGVVLGAFEEIFKELGSGNSGKKEVLKGFASVEAASLGSRGQYRDLTCLHVSEELRGNGIGRELFSLACMEAKRLGGEKLYISGHSAVETQRFYQSMGCREALEPMEEHVKREPYDVQLEKTL